MMNAQTTAAKLVKVEDFEGDGRCAVCGREGLRWIATLDDGRQVGLECAQAAIGFRPAAADYRWAADFHVIAEYSEYGDTWALWKHKDRNATRETRNGALMAVGGCRRTWIERGWLAA